jgi:hypothetical protein
MTVQMLLRHARELPIAPCKAALQGFIRYPSVISWLLGSLCIMLEETIRTSVANR